MLKIEIAAEIGSNWNGEISIAKEAIGKCKEAGADRVKFQVWRAKDLYSPTHPQWTSIQKSELKPDYIEELFAYARHVDIDWFASVFYPEAVAILERLGVKSYKVASRTCTLRDPGAKETLEAIAKTGKPVMISMGEGGDKELIGKIFKNNPVTFMYVISHYPTKEEEIDWKEAIRYSAFSDHTMSNTASIVYSGLKTSQKVVNRITIERHVKLESSTGPDAEVAISVEDLKDLVQHVRRIERMIF